MPRAFPVVLIPAEEGGFVVRCPVLVGCISQGETREEAITNIREAIELCLEDDAAEAERASHSEVLMVAC